ncbi:MAG: hypothetical protein H0U82_11865 [Actinobacteria bacterium]|nr:hypothetical protein [Actinomycetota bacterium]
MNDALTCLACGSTNPPGASFCAACGRKLSEAEAVAYTVSQPRLFGVLSPVAAFVLGCLLLLGAVVALVAASMVVGIVLLAATMATFVLFYGAAERDPSSSVARGAVTASARMRGWTSLTAGSTKAWTRTGRDLLRLRGELRALRDHREQAALGDAAYREDEAAVNSLRERMRELDAEIAAREQARTASLARARNRVADERLAARRTQVLSPVEIEHTRGTTDS